jgi:hypothetical protein
MMSAIKTHCRAGALALLLAVSALPVPAQAADPIFPKGSRIGMVPPGDMTTSKTFEGFADPQKSAAILITTLPAEAYDSLEKNGVPDALRKQGFAIDKREPIEIKAGKAFLVTGIEVVDNTRYRKWLLVAALSDLTALINVQTLETDATYSEKALRAALATITVRATVPDAERLSLLPFTFGDLAGFRVSDVLPGRAVILIDAPGDADKDVPAADIKARAMVAALGGGPSEPSDWASFARTTFGSISGIKDVHLQMSEPLRIGGQPGYQTLAKAKDATTGADIMVVQWLRFGGSSHVQMLGISRADVWSDEFPRLRTIRDNIDPR